jgi:Protein of unknown function (DUF1501)
MSGGPSQMESFDYKPILTQREGQGLPDSYRKGDRLPGMAGTQALLQLKGSPWAFARHGQSGAWVSDRYPHLSRMVDEIAFVKSMVSESVNHDPAITFMQTGSPLAGRPSTGAWVHYGLGSEAADLPAFVVLITRRAIDQPLSAKLWDSGFLPSRFQGVQFRAARDAVCYLGDPPGVTRESTRQALDTLGELYTARPQEFRSPDDDRVDSLVAQYEMAFRMQISVPEVTDLTREPASVDQLYGPDVRTPGTFAANCLLARRLVEKGTRFVQLFHPGWDGHSKMETDFPILTRETDQPCAGLLADLKQRGLLDETLVVWGGEFGRTCYAQGHIKEARSTYGRDHHPNCFTMWMAGGGIRPGMTYGASDEFAYHVAEDPVTVHDLHATMLHQLGIDHERFTYRFQGRDFRLTDVSGQVVRPILS